MNLYTKFRSGDTIPDIDRLPVFYWDYPPNDTVELIFRIGETITLDILHMVVLRPNVRSYQPSYKPDSNIKVIIPYKPINPTPNNRYILFDLISIDKPYDDDWVENVIYQDAIIAKVSFYTGTAL